MALGGRKNTDEGGAKIMVKTILVKASSKSPRRSTKMETYLWFQEQLL